MNADRIFCLDRNFDVRRHQEINYMTKNIDKVTIRPIILTLIHAMPFRLHYEPEEDITSNGAGYSHYAQKSYYTDIKRSCGHLFRGH